MVNPKLVVDNAFWLTSERIYTELFRKRHFDNTKSTCQIALIPGELSCHLHHNMFDCMRRFFVEVVRINML